MPQRLFQDPAGTIPAILAGQPVGMIKKAAGTVDATQATALSKPTLARHPKSGVRNLAMGAQAVNVSQYWSTTPSSGLARNRIGSGVEDGVPYVDYNIVGTFTTPEAPLYSPSSGAQPISPNAKYVARVDAKVIAGEMPVGCGIRIGVSEGSDAGSGYVRGTTGAFLSGPEYQTSIAIHTALGTDGANFVYPNLVIRGANGIAIDVTVRVKGLMFEKSPAATALQLNYGPNDITEPGVLDQWHIYNDGGDSLNVVLPAGTYGFATLDLATKVPHIDSVVSDGTTPINWLRHERQIEGLLRAGAFSDAEQRAIVAKWSEVY